MRSLCREFADVAEIAEIEDLRKSKIPVPYTDHDHGCCDFNPSMSHPLCGKCNRGLVCFRCNVMLGSAGDSVEILLSAAAYLKRWKRQPDGQLPVTPAIEPRPIPGRGFCL